MSKTDFNNQSKLGAKPGHNGPMKMMAAPITKAKDFKGTLIKLLHYLKPYWTQIIFVFIFAILSTVFSILSPKILGNMTNQIVDDYINITAYDQINNNMPIMSSLPQGTTGAEIIDKLPQEILNKIPEGKIEQLKALDLTVRPQMNFEKIAKIAIILLVLYVFSLIFGYIQGWIMANITQKVSFELRQDLSKKINRLPLKYFDKRNFGDVLSRVTNDVDTISQTLNQSLSQIVSAITMIVGILIMMLIISPLLTLVAIATLPLSMGLVTSIIKKSQKHFKNQQDSLGEINSHIEEIYAGHVVVKAFNGEKNSIKKFQDINNKLYGSSWKSQFLSGMMFPLMNFVGNLGYVGVAILGGWLALKGRIQIGDIQAFIQYVQQFNQPVAQIANIGNVMQSTIASAERVFEFLDEKEEPVDADDAKLLSNVRGEVEFKNVVFGYEPDKSVIKNLSAKIKPGQRVAIVGPTGAGKTTLVNLLMRFYDINSGKILIDGTDIRELKRSNLRRLFGMVLQDTWLFNGTIKENITYSKPNASEEEIALAAKTADIDHFVRALPDGYDMEINEEADNISQGEKQLLTIARAMLVKSSILILDEATSSVDTRTEALIQKALESMMKGKTSFVIAHRLSTIKNADLILVMKDGNVVELGKHNELLKKKGFYASIYNSQFCDADMAI